MLKVCILLSFVAAAAAATCATDGSSQSISVTESGTNWVITASGCPGYDWSSQSTPNSASTQANVMTVPMTPTLSDTPIYIGLYDATGGTNASPLMVRIHQNCAIQTAFYVFPSRIPWAWL